MKVGKRKAVKALVSNDLQATHADGVVLCDSALLLQEVQTPVSSLFPAEGYGAKLGDDSLLNTFRDEETSERKRRNTDSTFTQEIAFDDGKCICNQSMTGEGGSKPSPAEKKSALIRAEEARSNLEASFPSFVMFVSRTNVNSSFWMELPEPFCRSHLPNKDVDLTLVDECGEECTVRYIAQQTSLNGGWRHFAVSHMLLDEDALVFQLTENHKLKVYIIRANDIPEVDGALGLLNLDATAMEKSRGSEVAGDAVFGVKSCSSKRKRSSSAVEEEDNLTPPLLQAGQSVEQSENDGEEERCGLHIDDLKSPDLSEEVWIKYKALCRSQKASLHSNLLQDLNDKLIAGLVEEVVNVAGAMKVCTLFSTRDEFERWEKALMASETLGMNIGFLRSGCQKLMNVACDSECSRDARRYMEVKSETEKIERVVRELEAKLEELKSAHEKCAAELENAKSNAERYESKIREEISNLW